jgi:hypothetical protein
LCLDAVAAASASAGGGGGSDDGVMVACGDDLDTQLQYNLHHNLLFQGRDHLPPQNQGLGCTFYD